jgi:uncharacterized protein (DUF934 family)
MTLLSLTGIETREWDVLADGETPAEGATIAVPLARLLEDGDAVFASAGQVGAIIPTGTDFNELEELSQKIAFAIVQFPAFGDGRGFSLAVRLRKDFGFKGEIRAAGPVIPDQALFLLRAGFDSVALEDDCRQAAFETALSRFKNFYQTDFTGARSLAFARHGNAGERIAS